MTTVVLATGTAKQGERGFDSLPFSKKKRLISRAWVTKSRTLCQAFLVETVETGTKNRCVIEATHLLLRKLRKY